MYYKAYQTEEGQAVLDDIIEYCKSSGTVETLTMATYIYGRLLK